MRRTALGILTLLTLLAPTRVTAQDNGDGTYTNPSLHADYPDPDVIRVGSARERLPACKNACRLPRRGQQ